MSIKGVLWIKSTLVLVMGLAGHGDQLLIKCWWFGLVVYYFDVSAYIYIFLLGNLCIVFFFFFAGKSTINRNHQVNYWY